MMLLAPYAPSPSAPWDRRRAGHLLRRAGFGGTEEEIQRALGEGPRAAVERVLSPGEDDGRGREIDEMGDRIASKTEIRALRGWWAMKLLRAGDPLRAKIFETLGMGPFEDLAQAVAKDPAMIVWLDGQENRRGAPNENFARELLELFTLGIGNYTERDIQEAARAFTGWDQDRGAFVFRERRHDTGPKTVFGQTQDFDGGDIIRLCLEQPAAGRFLAGKVYAEFVGGTADGSLLEEMADVLRGSNYSIGELLSVLLRSEAFFSEDALRLRVKSPVEFAVGAARSLEARVDGYQLAQAMADMGQRLFEPPSVAGWDGGRSWINSATMLVRINTISALASGLGDGRGLDAEALCEKHGLRTKKAAIQFASGVMLDGAAPDVLQGPLGQVADAADSPAAALRGAVRLIGSSPEYQFA